MIQKHCFECGMALIEKELEEEGMQSRRKLILRYIKLLLRKEKSQKKNGCSGSMFCLLMVQRSLPQSSWKRISETLRMQPFGRL